MYQPFFGLTRRPFSATPDIHFYYSTDALDAAEIALINCLVSGQGIAVLTAPPGMGKTAFCQHLVSEFPAPHQVVFLSNSNFPTRRSLLQSILFELGQPYSNMGEQELRLELTAFLRTMHQQEQPVVLVVDEAHLLNNRVLEELRTLTDLTCDGDPLVRLLLCGQLSLDEKLAHPTMEALNQRISTQIYVESFTRQESADYIAHRLSMAGVSIDDVFTSEALDLIVQASDGLPRCINQLCDHSLLLGYMIDNKPINAEVAREALDDLKQLPLHWNEPTPALSPLDQLRRPQQGDRSSASISETQVVDSDEEHDTYGLIESSNPEFTESVESSEFVSEGSAAFEIGADDIETVESLDLPGASVVARPVENKIKFQGEWQEEAVVDHYSQLDALFEQTGRKAIRTEYPFVSTAVGATDLPDEDEVLELEFDDDDTLEFTDSELTFEIDDFDDNNVEQRPATALHPLDVENCIADINVSLEAAVDALQALIGHDAPAELTAQWDTFSIAVDQQEDASTYDADDLMFGAEDLSDLDVPSQLVRALKAHAGSSGSAATQEEQLARQMIELLEESTPARGPAPQIDSQSPSAWYGSNDLYSDLQEYDPFDDESAFLPAKRFDVVQPDDILDDEPPRAQPLFPPSFAASASTNMSERTYEEHSPEPPAPPISPKSFVRLFSELRRRQQRSA